MAEFDRPDLIPGLSFGMNPEALADLLRAQNRILALRTNTEPGPRVRSGFVRILARILNFSF